MVKSYLTKNPLETKALGRNLAKKFLKIKKRKKALILALEGELGSGKTTFLQGFAKGLGIKEKILSPTFVLMKKFQIPNSKLQITASGGIPLRGTNSKFEIPKFKTFYHIDCYRLEKPEEILALGFKKIISNPRNIVAIEWADRIRKILPKNTFRLKFEIISKNSRKIIIPNNIDPVVNF